MKQFFKGGKNLRATNYRVASMGVISFGSHINLDRMKKKK